MLRTSLIKKGTWEENCKLIIEIATGYNHRGNGFTSSPPHNVLF